MSPKKKVQAAPALPQAPPARPPAPVGRLPAVDGGEAPSPTVNPAVLTFNATHLEYIRECVRKIEAHPLMEDITRAEPISQADGAREAPLTMDAYTTAMQNSGCAKGGFNFFCLNFMLDPLVAHVPVKRKKMEHMAATRFATPTHTTDIHVAMAKNGNPFDMVGKLRMLSPAEPVHAMLMAIRRDIDIGNEEVIRHWRRISLSTCMIFQEFENSEAFHFAHLQLRENPGIDFELVRHSALQRVLDIAQFHTRTFSEKGVRLTPKDLSATYKKLQVAEQSEKITESFCDMAMTVYNRLVVKTPSVFRLLLDHDEAFGMSNPLDSVTKLQALVIKANTKEKLEFMVPLMLDLLQSGALHPDTCTVRSLKGASGASKGLCDVLLVKEDLREYLHRWSAEQAFSGDVLNTMRRITVSHSEFRKHCGYSWKPSASKPNLSWKSGWKPSADLLLSFFRDGHLPHRV